MDGVMCAIDAVGFQARDRPTLPGSGPRRWAYTPPIPTRPVGLPHGTGSSTGV
jgi:hypothetical protein